MGVARLGLLMVATVFAVCLGGRDAAASILDSVKDAGVLRCGVQEIGPAFSNIDETGHWVGFYADLCRATAAAVLGDPDAVEFVVVGTDDRFSALRDGDFDVLMSSATWTMGRDIDGLTFMPLYLFDGQGFLAHKAFGAKDIGDLKNATICVEDHTTSVANVRDYDKTKAMNWTVKTFATVEGAFNAFFERQCDSVTTDVMSLASNWSFLAPNPDEDVILPTQISKEPLSAVVRDGDDAWADAVRWVINALIAAEELGVTSRNVEDMKTAEVPEVRRLLGTEGDLGEQLGLDKTFAVRALEAMGNYGEIYDRTIKKQLHVERGLNNLWVHGGLIWSPPIR
ncbi:MAG: amino acid ABC transporter substrate-binding protein [Rhodospirillum sp.]|nr:amino acid ABC transporter substrate-binding protein [Rhodospirillum sp.]MCF8488877.1 amino acid ABC transporter substrate-binding protein [Rhodospirillum sp.]MCF8503064.1 amino acid ABC transporter substrate-binding protein [Rhodospirillum sp.]